MVGETPPHGLDTRFIDTTADPCVDFAQYACGKFGKLYPIPYNRAEYDPSTLVAEHTERVLRSLLETAGAGGTKRTSNEQKIGDYYASCMAIDTIDQNGLKPLQPELARITALTGKDELPELLAHFQLINVAAFFTFGQQPDFRDARKQIAGLDQSSLGLPERDFYLRTSPLFERRRAQYVRHITNILKLLGEPTEKADEDAQKIIQLETALAEVSLDAKLRRDPSNVHHIMSVSQLASLTPGFSWDTFFKKMGVPAISELNVANPGFFKGLDFLLASTDLGTIKIYLRWQLLHSLDGLVLPQSFDDEIFDFYVYKFQGQPERRDRWQRCVQATDQAMGEALGQVYVSQEFKPTSNKVVRQILHDVEAAMDQDLETLDWMSPATKAQAKDKLHAIVYKIGYPDEWRDYSGLNVVRGDAFGNYLRAVEFENRYLLSKIGQLLNRGEWGMSSGNLSAYYNPSSNDINLNAAFLQPPYYDQNATDAENYGHIGSVIGHELIHAFDDTGRHFDPDGNLADWWTADDDTKLKERADCVAEEYNNFVAVGDVKVNGASTLSENIADNGGLRLAYLAFLADARRKDIDLTKKQDGYTEMQQFFLGYAQNWCGSIRSERLRLQAENGPRSPRRFRINGVVRNMSDFGRVFGCKTGDPMMPANACRVW